MNFEHLVILSLFRISILEFRIFKNYVIIILLMKNFRPLIDEYFLKIAMVVSERATCLRHNVGAVLVRDKHILTTGYNGATAGVKDCIELGCLRDQQNIPSGTKHEICRAIHAEMNAVIQAALHGVSTEGATMYCTHTPCIICAKILANAKIKKFVTFGDYPDYEFLKLFDEARIEFITLPRPKFSKEEAIKEERVLVVESDIFNKLCPEKGFITKDLKEIYKALLENCKFMDRDSAENNEDYKQIVPQNLIKYENKYFLMKKLSKSKESRLHDLYYLGAGGHIDLTDSNDEKGDVIFKGMWRELMEEITVDTEDFELKGIINVDEKPVDKEHIGLVYLTRLNTNKVFVKEREKMEGELVSLAGLEKKKNELDSWSQVILKELIQKELVKK